MLIENIFLNKSGWIAESKNRTNVNPLLVDFVNEFDCLIVKHHLSFFLWVFGRSAMVTVCWKPHNYCQEDHGFIIESHKQYSR